MVVVSDVTGTTCPSSGQRAIISRAISVNVLDTYIRPRARRGEGFSNFRTARFAGRSSL